MLEIYNEEYKDLLARKKVADGKAHKVRWACLPELSSCALLLGRVISYAAQQVMPPAAPYCAMCRWCMTPTAAQRCQT